MANLLVLPRPAERAEWRRLERKNLIIISLPKRKGWPHCLKESSWQIWQNRLCQKEQSHPFRSPDREVGESQDERELHLGERKGDSTVKEGKFQGGEEGHAKRILLGEVEKK